MPTHAPKDAKAILEDPDGHFPYKMEAAIEGHPNEYGEDGSTSTKHVERWVVLPEEAEAAAAHVAAQEAHLRKPTEDTETARRETAQRLQEVRAAVREKRRNYPGGYVAGNMILHRES